MQNAGLAALGLNWRYLAFDVPPADLAAALVGAKAMGFIGINLTVPHKQLALALVDELEASGREFGAVNTVRFEGKDAGGDWQPLANFSDPPRQIRSHGFNTDADAMVRAIHEDLELDLTGTRVLLLGAGGAGRTAALKLASAGLARMYLVNRTAARSAAVAAEIQARIPGLPLELDYPSGPVDLVMNATSLGLHPNDPLPFDEQRFSLTLAKTAFDLIYRPAETPFLQRAKAAGCRTANGLGMLLYQGAKALEIWSGRSAPIEQMRRALEKNIYG